MKSLSLSKFTIYNNSDKLLDILNLNTERRIDEFNVVSWACKIPEFDDLNKK